MTQERASLGSAVRHARARLANANKFEHIRQVNMELGLFVPSLVTPAQLLKEE